MDEATRTGGPVVDDDKRGPEEIRADIEQTREELGDTVEALAAKTDVKARSRAKVDDAKDQAKAKVDEAKQRALSKLDAAKARVNASHGDPAPPAPGGAYVSTGVPGAGSGPDVKQRAADVKRQVARTASDNPVATRIVAAFAAGLLTGLILRRRR